MRYKVLRCLDFDTVFPLLETPFLHRAGLGLGSACEIHDSPDGP